MPRIETRKCQCDHRYDVLWTRTGPDKAEEPSALDRPEIDNLTCPKCGADNYRVVVGLATGIELGGAGGVGRMYPYYDRALGCWVDSAQHRRRLCKERNLIPAADFDPVADFQKIKAERDQAEAEYQQMVAETQADPELREAYGRMQERLEGVRSPDEAVARLRGRG